MSTWKGELYLTYHFVMPLCNKRKRLISFEDGALSMFHSKQKGQRYRRRQADDKEQHNEKEKAILRQGDNCDDQNRTCVFGPFNTLFLA